MPVPRATGAAILFRLALPAVISLVALVPRRRRAAERTRCRSCEALRARLG